MQISAWLVFTQYTGYKQLTITNITCHLFVYFLTHVNKQLTLTSFHRKSASAQSSCVLTTTKSFMSVIVKAICICLLYLLPRQFPTEEPFTQLQSLLEAQKESFNSRPNVSYGKSSLKWVVFGYNQRVVSGDVSCSSNFWDDTSHLVCWCPSDDWTRTHQLPRKFGPGNGFVNEFLACSMKYRRVRYNSKYIWNSKYRGI